MKNTKNTKKVEKVEKVERVEKVGNTEKTEKVKLSWSVFKDANNERKSASAAFKAAKASLIKAANTNNIDINVIILIGRCPAQVVFDYFSKRYNGTPKRGYSPYYALLAIRKWVNEQ